MIPTFLLVWFNSLCLLLLIIALFFCFITMNQGPVVGDEPCFPVGDVALNVSSSKVDDVAVNASKVCFSVHHFVAYFSLLVLLILFTFFEFLFSSDY